MKKVLLQALILVALFYTTWFALGKIDFISILKIKKVTDTTEEKLGDLIWEVLKKTEREIKSTDITSPVDSILNRICESNHIDRERIKLHIVEKDEINAFALPNNHLVIYSGLIIGSANEAELSGVIGHEVAHMEKNHVMKKLVSEIGLSVLISMTTGSNNPEMITQTVKLLTSSAYDRSLEKEADLQSVDYLIKANIDPKPFADFLYKLGSNETPLSWISTHPESKERAEYIIEYIDKRTGDYKTTLAPQTWEDLNNSLKN